METYRVWKKNDSNKVLDFSTREDVVMFVKNTGIAEKNIEVRKVTDGIWGSIGNNIAKSIYKAAHR